MVLSALSSLHHDAPEACTPWHSILSDLDAVRPGAAPSVKYPPLGPESLLDIRCKRNDFAIAGSSTMGSLEQRDLRRAEMAAAAEVRRKRRKEERERLAARRGARRRSPADLSQLEA